MKKKIDFWHIIPMTLVNLPGIVFVYLFFAPSMKITTGKFVDSIIKLSNFSKTEIEYMYIPFGVVVMISLVGLLGYYIWHDDGSEDMYIPFLIFNLFFIFALIILLLASYNFHNQCVIVIQKIAISIFTWSLFWVTANRLNKYNINDNKFFANLVIISPILISLLALIYSYFS